MTHDVIEGMEPVRKALSDACKFGGGQKRWAAEHGVSQTYVNDMLRGTKPVSDRVARMFGYERVLLFRRQTSGPRSEPARLPPVILKRGD